VPYRPEHLTIWLVLSNAITANNPEPSEKDLTDKYLATIPTIDVNKDNTGKLRMGGRRLLFCPSYLELASMLVVAGAVPKQITNEGSTISCFTRPAIG